MKLNILDDVEGGFANLTDAPPDKVESFEIPDPSYTSVAKIGEIADTGQGGQEEQTELLENMVSARRTMIIAARALIENYERDGTVYLSDVSEFGAGIDNMIPLIARFLAIENEEVAAAQQEIQATISGARRLTITLASVTIVLAIGLGLVLSRSILSPINRLREVTEDLGNGNLGVRAHIESNNEIGSLANSFNQMAAARQLAEEQRLILIAKLEDQNSELEDAYKAQRHAAEEIAVMAEIGRTISSSPNIGDVYEIFDENDNGTMSPTWVLGTDVPDLREGDDFPMEKSLAGEVVRTKAPYMLEADTEPDLEDRFPGLIPVYNAGTVFLHGSTTNISRCCYWCASGRVQASGHLYPMAFGITSANGKPNRRSHRQRIAICSTDGGRRKDSKPG